MSSEAASDLTILLTSCRTGDQRAVDQLVKAFEAGVFRFALSILDDPYEAGEITQETFIRALKALPSYREKSSFKAWLYKITLNLSRSHLRKRKSLRRLDQILAGAQIESQRSDLPEELAVRNERDHTLWSALVTLDEKHRLPLILRYFHEMSIAEIANLLGLKEGTVHSRLHTGRESLRSALINLDGD